MINKIKTLRKRKWLIISGAILLTTSVVVAGIRFFNHTEEGEANLVKIKDVEVSQAQMKEYRERIGTTMDTKKSYLILFEDEKSCIEFIETHGMDDDPTAAGIGIIPYMETGYYNVAGKKSLEEAFDLLADGEYSKEPVIYSNVYCYLKRIGTESPLKDDKVLKDLIMNEKRIEIKKAGD